VIHQEVDPIRTIRALAFSRHLRTPALFQDALEDAALYEAVDQEEEVEPRDDSADPSFAHIKKAATRADVVCMSLMRRKFVVWRSKDLVEAINIYSDASPVTGTELQGMIIDICLKNGVFYRLVLPGSTLAYGHTDTLSKSVALVWALWLVAGPELEALQYACDKVRSFTTDFGVEMGLLGCSQHLRGLFAMGRRHASVGVQAICPGWQAAIPKGYEGRWLVSHPRRDHENDCVFLRQMATHPEQESSPLCILAEPLSPQACR